MGHIYDGAIRGCATYNSACRVGLVSRNNNRHISQSLIQSLKFGSNPMVLIHSASINSFPGLVIRLSKIRSMDLTRFGCLLGKSALFFREIKILTRGKPKHTPAGGISQVVCTRISHEFCTMSAGESKNSQRHTKSLTKCPP